MSTKSLRMETSAFDALASDYDAAFTRSRLGEFLRSVVWAHLDDSLPAGGRILEIGCGTGEDAIHMARLGYEVCATDDSERMLEMARHKACRFDFGSRIDFRRVPMEKLAAEFDGQSFDAIFSNFGVLNCAQDIARVMTEIAGLARCGAPLVCVIMGRYVPWEWIWFAARLKWHKALRRLSRDGTPWRGMRIRYPTASAIRRSLEPYFEKIEVSPLGFVLPPSYASGWLESSDRTFRALAWIERSVHRYSILSDFSDHYIVIARRNAVPTNA